MNIPLLYAFNAACTALAATALALGIDRNDWRVWMWGPLGIFIGLAVQRTLHAKAAARDAAHATRQVAKELSCPQRYMLWKAYGEATRTITITSSINLTPFTLCFGPNRQQGTRTLLPKYAPAFLSGFKAMANRGLLVPLDNAAGGMWGLTDTGSRLAATIDSDEKLQPNDSAWFQK